MGQKTPWFHFYPKDWLSSPDVRMMSNSQRGVYITLLAAAWDSDEPGTLPYPADDAARSAGLDPRSVRDLLKHFPRCFVKIASTLPRDRLDLGSISARRRGDITLRLANHKLVTQWAELTQYKQKQSLAGKMGNEKRWNEASQVRSQPDRSAFALASAFASKDIKTGVGFSTGHTRKVEEAAKESHVGEGPSDTGNLGGFVLHECRFCSQKFTRSALDRHLKSGCTPLEAK
jgi:hypothetical protein